MPQFAGKWMIYAIIAGTGALVLTGTLYTLHWVVLDVGTRLDLFGPGPAETAGYVQALSIWNEILFAAHALAKLTTVILYLRRSSRAVTAWTIGVVAGLGDWVLLSFNHFDLSTLFTNLMLGLDLIALLALIFMAQARLFLR